MHQVTDSRLSNCYNSLTNSELSVVMNSPLNYSVNGSNSYHSNEDDDNNDDGGDNENDHGHLGAEDNSYQQYIFLTLSNPRGFVYF